MLSFRGDTDDKGEILFCLVEDGAEGLSKMMLIGVGQLPREFLNSL